MIAFRRLVFAVSLGSLVLAAGCAGAGGGATALPAGPQMQSAGVQPQSAGVQTQSVASLPVATPTPSGPAALGRYAIDPRKIYVAGISSGGFFAVQMQVAHSATIHGAAIYAGGVYYCALDSVGTALLACGGETVNGQALYASTLAESETYLDAQSKLGTIDNESNLRGQPVYLWSGTQDEVVNPKEMADLHAEYEHYGARIVRFDNAFPAEHGWESPDGELACGTLGEPYMIACNAGAKPYDSEAVWMSAFFGRLAPRNGHALQGTLINFDQTAFGASPTTNSMDTNGYVYVPRACASRGRDRDDDRGRHDADDGCGLVVAFHGCQQTQADIGTKFVTESGIDEWADTNRVVVLYPYAVRSTAPIVNPQGCWDWWGYDDPNYSTKSGTQISIVYKMVQRLTGQ